jgi:arylsulfatase A-like enzyme
MLLSSTGLCIAATTAIALWIGRAPMEPDFPTPRLVLLYATCSLNKDFLSPYDPSIAYTPSLDRFKYHALVFNKHHTETGQSGVAFASIFSGTQATHHGVFSHPTRMADGPLLIAEAFKEAGYETFAFLHHGMASAMLNYAQGVSGENAHSAPLQAENQEFRRVLQRLRKDREYRAFIVTNFTVTHGPYKGRWLGRFCGQYPPECEARADLADFDKYRLLYGNNHLKLSWDFAEAVDQLELSAVDIERLIEVTELLYKADVYRLDRMFGEVVETIKYHGLLEESLIAFTSDHGEIHYRDNAFFRWTHGRQLAPEDLNVPFILAGPSSGVVPGTYDSVSRSIDVFPTLAGLSGVSVGDLDGFGVDLSQAARGQQPPPELLAFSHTDLIDEHHWRRNRNYKQLATLFPEQIPELMWVAVRKGDLFFKIRRVDGRHWRRSVFHLALDPGETKDLYDPVSVEQRGMFEMLEEYKARMVEAAHGAGGTIPREEALELLRSLGYIE